MYCGIVVISFKVNLLNNLNKNEIWSANSPKEYNIMTTEYTVGFKDINNGIYTEAFEDSYFLGSRK